MPLEMARRINELNNASQIEKVIDNHASGLPLYGVITVSKDNTNDTYRYQKSAKIDREGIYFTLLVYAPVTNFNQTNNYSVFGDEGLYQESEK